MRTIKLYAGMTGEYEIIKTDAPDNIIEEQLKENNRRKEKDENIKDPYDIIHRNGFKVAPVACLYDFDDEEEEPRVDAEFDCYDY